MNILNKLLTAKCNCVSGYYGQEAVKEELDKSCSNLRCAIRECGVSCMDNNGDVIDAFVGLLISIQSYLCTGKMRELEGTIDQRLNEKLEGLREDFKQKMAKNELFIAGIKAREEALSKVAADNVADDKEGGVSR